MFYTKYRPQKFSEVSRPNQTAESLEKQVATAKTVHAYLFVGPRGTGKTSLARILAKALNCEDLDKNGNPCGKCDACIAIKSGTYLDLIEIDAASNRGIDDIRELKNKIKLAPSVGKNKIYIIDEVHMMTTEAFNALLKTLEEPPKNTVFILCTTELHKVPDTIKSRCQVFRFKRATIEQLVEKLEKICKSEKIKVSKPDLEKIAKASLGGFRDAETLLQQVVEGEVSVDALVSGDSFEKFIDFTNFLLQKNSGKALETISSLMEDGKDIQNWVGEYTKFLRDLLLLKSGVSQDKLELTDKSIQLLQEISQMTQLRWLVTCINKFAEAHFKTKNSLMMQLPVEIAIVEVCGFFGDENSENLKNNDNEPPESLVTVIKTLEKQIKLEKPVQNSAPKLKIEINKISDKWSEVMTKVSAVNQSILSLLKFGKPVKVQGGYLVLEVFYSFHKERLESPKTREIVEKVLKEVFEIDINIKCEVSKEQRPEHLKSREVGVLTDINVAPVSKDAVIEMLDGGLPM